MLAYRDLTWVRQAGSSAPCTIEIVSGHLLRQHAARIREVPVKALTITLAAGAALCGVMSTPTSAMPISNLAAAASDLALGQSVQYGRHHHRYRLNSYRTYGYGYGGHGVGFGFGHIRRYVCSPY